MKYATGEEASQGNRVRLIDTGEVGYLRVLGINDYVTVMFGDISRPDARVVHISEIEPEGDRRSPC